MKLILSAITNFFKPSALTTMAANQTAIVNAVEDSLSKSGQGNNHMAADLDMNSNRVLNLPDPVDAHEPIPYHLLTDLTGTAQQQQANVNAAIARSDADRVANNTATGVAIGQAGVATTNANTAATGANTAATNANNAVLSMGATFIKKAGDTVTGNISFGGAYRVINLLDPVNATDAATKGWVLAYIAGGGAGNLDSKVNKGGDTMTGDLVLAGNPVTNNSAVSYTFMFNNTVGLNTTTSQMDAHGKKIQSLAAGSSATDAANIQNIADATAQRVGKSGDTMTGDLILAGAPLTDNSAVSRSYLAVASAPVYPLRDENARPHWREAMTAYRELDYHFWDPSRNNGDTNLPGAIRPIDSYGLINNSLSQTNFWTMSQYVNVIYWHWRLTKSEITRQKLVAQAKWIKLAYTQAKRQSANVSNNDGAVTWSDDAMWNCNAYMQLFEATGDRTWLTDAQALLQSTMSVFADPNNSGSPYGLYYSSASQVSAGQDGGHGRVSSSYEAGLGATSMRIFIESGNGGFLNYGSSVRDIMTNYFVHPTGYLYCEFDLDPSHADNGNDQGYKKAKGRGYGPPVRSNSASFSGGTLMFAVLCARLFRYNGNTTYLTQIQNVATNFVKTNAFLRTNIVASGLFLNERDPWDDGYWYPYFVEECLSLPGVDSTGAFKTALLNTCDYIAQACRTSDGYYGADWSGDEYVNYPGTGGNGSNPYSKWQAQAGSGSQPSFARADQIMTSSSTMSLMFAAAMLTRDIRRDTF